jgi:type IV pilus assembly protein PilW
MITFDEKFQYSGLPGVRRRERGLTLIELMISITLGLMILAGMVTVFANTSAVRNEIERTSRQIENGRYAIELLREDIQLAGYFGETNMALVALPVVAAPPGQPDPCSVTLATWTGAMPLHVQGIDGFDGVTAPTMSCLPDVKAGTDVIVIRRLKTCVFGAAGCDSDNDLPYLQSPLCNTEVTTHTLGVKSATAFAHQKKDCTTATDLRPYVVYFYYVGTDNTLRRAQFIGAKVDPVTGTNFQVTPLVDGIENLQFDYGVDTDGDGDADSYQARPANVADWSSVMTVQVNLLARNVDLSPGYKDTKTYSLGPSAGSVGPFNDGRRRHVYSALVRIQNASGRRETP